MNPVNQKTSHHAEAFLASRTADDALWSIIEELLVDGTVKVARLSGDQHVQPTIVSRDQLQLAPP